MSMKLFAVAAVLIVVVGAAAAVTYNPSNDSDGEISIPDMTISERVSSFGGVVSRTTTRIFHGMNPNSFAGINVSERLPVSIAEALSSG